jgi:L-2,4-diaminobutyrate decarboxylase
VAAAPVLSTLVFRYLPAGGDGEQSDRANRHARKALYASGEAVVAGTVVAGRQHMKFTLLNPRTTPADISAVLDLLAGHAERYVAEEDERRAS